MRVAFDIIDWIELDNSENLDVKDEGGIWAFDNKLGILDIIDWEELDNGDNLDVKNEGFLWAFGEHTWYIGHN